MSNQPAPQQRQTVDIMLQNAKDQIAKALPSVIGSDRFIRVALSEIRKSPQLQQCNPMSICSAVMQAAQLGLEFGSTLGHAYLIPYKSEATLQVGYRGLMHLCRRSGMVKKFEARAVYEGDFFEYELGTEPFIKHRPTGTQKNMVAVYAVATLEDGSTQFDVMSREALEEHQRKYSRNNGTWNTAFEEMAKKTIIKRLIKLLPISTEVAEALERDVDSVIEVREPEKIQKLTENTNSYVSKAESTAIMDELEKLCLKATELKVDIEDMPDDFTDQTALAWSQILKERIKSHESQLSNRGAN
jgi:recombination protein RecT